ncbi:RNA 3'-terminal phosphate cyclase/enolpyruvate transferase, alpha/beta [Pseudocohnilembus persalinus]|uniref:RNA 3'-terminal phosphate cyclase/enolpyruvate transferase, alpha/beta n=1 Tax=Pseudocohnilembus persalinus TaxID=266149 RepID=A0A0V0R1H8_PSEPJ|nr:RNA 3'-terminal phosphate cyclase/enolpyruvate transferase, alpha/beta [Pseudocohnilembus persalinus]|eukprot:KRX08377.1 RNA 3'-terminal phosphate cyclase/enolpyruvate transferase, alpha/beta [Pseudocohnilembus persalinus]
MSEQKDSYSSNIFEYFVVMGLNTQGLNYSSISQNIFNIDLIDIYPNQNPVQLHHLKPNEEIEIPDFIDGLKIWCFPNGIQIYDADLNQLNQNISYETNGQNEILHNQYSSKYKKIDGIHEKDVIFQFVTTDANYTKRYCTCLQFYINLSPQNFSYKALYKRLKLVNIIKIIKYILLEKQIIFFCQNPGDIPSMTEALLSYITPLTWNSIYIPFLRASLWEQISAPMGYIIGFSSSSKEHILREIQKLMPWDRKRIVIVDMDKAREHEQIVEEEDEEVSKFPEVAKQYLLENISKVFANYKKQLNGENSNWAWSKVVLETQQIFNNMMLILINNFPIFFKQRGLRQKYSEVVKGEDVQPLNQSQAAAIEIFNFESYIQMFPESHKQFMTQFSQTMMFSKLIEDSYGQVIQMQKQSQEITEYLEILSFFPQYTQNKKNFIENQAIEDPKDINAKFYIKIESQDCLYNLDYKDQQKQKELQDYQAKDTNGSDQKKKSQQYKLKKQKTLQDSAKIAQANNYYNNRLQTEKSKSYIEIDKKKLDLQMIDGNSPYQNSNVQSSIDRKLNYFLKRNRGNFAGNQNNKLSVSIQSVTSSVNYGQNQQGQIITPRDQLNLKQSQDSLQSQEIQRNAMDTSLSKMQAYTRDQQKSTPQNNQTSKIGQINNDIDNIISRYSNNKNSNQNTNRKNSLKSSLEFDEKRSLNANQNFLGSQPMINNINQKNQNSEVEQLLFSNVDQDFTFEVSNKTPKNQKLNLQSGEMNKSQQNLEQLHNLMFENQFSRNDLIIGFGGGMTTDFAGYAASIYMRGIKYFSISTTVLGISDAVVGSKTAINNSYGKNQIGSFYDPSAIFVNVNFLKTLDDRNFSNGLVEIIKMGMIKDIELFQLLEKFDLKSLRRSQNQKFLQFIMQKSVENKLEVVNCDKKEGDLRKILNFGHTFGHGIEHSSKEQILHGEAVAMGIMLALELSNLKNIIQDYHQIKEKTQNIFKKYNIPSKVPEFIDTQQVLNYMMMDKKNMNNQIHFILLEKLGKAQIKTVPVEQNLLQQIISPQIQIDFEKNQIINNEFKSLNIPGSKSITNRLFIMIALSEQKVKIYRCLFSEDTEIMINALVNLGSLQILEKNETYFEVQGQKIQKSEQDIVEIFVGNSGTTARFLITYIISQGLKGQKYLIKGIDRMHERPIQDLLQSLEQSQQDNQLFTYLGKQYHFPLIIENKYDGLKGGQININSDVSSQFITSILLSAPYAKENIELNLLSDQLEQGKLQSANQQNQKLISEDFIQLTIQMMEKLGIKIERINQQKYIIEKNQHYQFQDNKYYVEPDGAALSYYIFGSIISEQKIKIEGFNYKKSLQGDVKFVQKLQQLGFQFEITEEQFRFDPTKKENSLVQITQQIEQKNQSDLIQFDFNDCTDTFITFAVLVAILDIKKKIQIVNIANQRVKECDRLYAVSRNLFQFGINSMVNQDGITVLNRNRNFQQVLRRYQNQNINIQCYNDHRIAMAFSLLSLFFMKKIYDEKIEKSENKFVILDKYCVNKTFPNYWQEMENNFGMKIQGNQQGFKNQFQVIQLDFEPIFIVGMRASGKTSMAEFLGKKLQCKVYHIDDMIFKRVQDNSQGDIEEIVKCIEAQNQQNNIARPNLPGNQTLKKIYEEERMEKYQQISDFIFSVPNLTEPQNSQLNQKLYWEKVENQSCGEGGQFSQKNLQYYGQILVEIQKYCIFELIDVEYNPVKQNKIIENDRIRLIQKINQSIYKGKIIFSKHYLQELKEDSVLKDIEQMVQNKNNFEILKICLNQFHSDLLLTKIQQLCQKNQIKLVIIKLGIQGKMSRIINNFLTPVFDSILSPNAVIQGQVEKNEIIRLRKELNLHQTIRIVYLFGKDISLSYSPLIQDLAYQQLGSKISNFQEHIVFQKQQVDNLTDILPFIKNNPRFLGACVTMPFKQQLLPYLDVLHDEAKQIKVVNTIVKCNGVLHGYNTDIYGIYKPLVKRMANQNLQQQQLQLQEANMKQYLQEQAKKIQFGLVIGAGSTSGTAVLCMRKLNLTPLVWNRSQDNLNIFVDQQNNLNDKLKCVGFTDFEEIIKFIQQNGDLKIIISTIPGKSEVQIPKKLFDQYMPWVFDVSYFPKKTNIIRLLESYGKEDSQNNIYSEKIIYGIEMLIYQAFKQIEIFTGFKVKRSEIKKQALEQYWKDSYTFC